MAADGGTMILPATGKDHGNRRGRAPGMVSRVHTVAFQGIDVLDVDVQVQMASGLPAFTSAGSPANQQIVGEYTLR